MNKKYTILLISFLLLLNACYNKKTESENETISDPVERREMLFTSGSPESSIVYKTLYNIYTEVFDRMGYSFSCYYSTAKRAAIDADSGDYDGTVSRNYNFNIDNEYPDLIRVEESIYKAIITAYTLNDEIKIDGLESLKNQEYMVGIKRGMKEVENNIYNYIDEEYVIIANDSEQLIYMLEAERIDFIDSFDQINQILKSDEFKVKNILDAGAISEILLYPYFHVKNREIIEEFKNILLEMKEDGSYEEIVNDIRNSESENY